MRNVYTIGDLSTGKQCLIIRILRESAMENSMRKGDLKGNFWNPREIPHVVKGLRPMTPAACQQVALPRNLSWVMPQESIVREHEEEVVKVIVKVTTGLLSQSTPGRVPLFKRCFHVLTMFCYPGIHFRPCYNKSLSRREEQKKSLMIQYIHLRQGTFESLPWTSNITFMWELIKM